MKKLLWSCRKFSITSLCKPPNPSDLINKRVRSPPSRSCTGIYVNCNLFVIFLLKGLILGVYEPEKENEDMELTEAAENLNISLSGQLVELLKL